MQLKAAQTVLNIRFFPCGLWSLGQRIQLAGREFHSIAAEHLNDMSGIDLLDATAGPERVMSLEDLVERAG